MADKKISQLPNLDRVNYTPSDLLLINHGLAPYSSQTTSNTSVVNFMKYYTGTTNYITGVTFSLGILTMYVNGTLQTIPVTGLTSTYLTGGTYSKVLSAMTFTNNTGGTFNVTGMYFPKVPSGTLNSIQYNNNQRFSGNTLIYNSGTTSIYNRGYNGITGNTFYGEDAGGRVTDSGTTIFGYQSFTHTGATGNNNTGVGSSVFNNLYSTTNTNNTSIGYNNTFSGKSLVTVTNQTSVGSNSVTNGVPYNYATIFGDNIFTSGGDTSYKSNNGVFFGSNILNIGYSIQSTIVGNLTYSAETLQQQNGTNTILGNLTFNYNAGPYNNTYYNTILGNNLLNRYSYYQFKSVFIGNNTGRNLTQENPYSVFLGNNILNVNNNNLYSKGFAVTWVGDGTNSNVIIRENGQNGKDSLLGTNFRSNTGNTSISCPRVVIGNGLGISTFGGILNIGYNNFSDRCWGYNSIIIGSNIFPVYIMPINNTYTQLTSSVYIGRDIVKYATSGDGTPGQNDGQSIIIGDNACVSGASILKSVHIGRYTAKNLNVRGDENTGRSANVTYGEYSLFNGTKSTLTVSVGSYSLYSLSGTNYENISIGYSSGYNLINDSYNTFVGSFAGYSLTAGTNNTFIGYNTNYSAKSISNIVYLGNSSINKIYAQPTSITLLSDKRDKKNIENLELGVDFINELRPSKFEWSLREGKRLKDKSSGFIAQEIKSVEEKFNSCEFTNLSQKISDEYLTVSYDNLIPIMVKSLKELSKKNKELKERIKKLTI